MSAWLVAVLLAGPPKLPPVGGRSLPPEQPTPDAIADDGPAAAPEAPPASPPPPKSPATGTSSAVVPPPPASPPPGRPPADPGGASPTPSPSPPTGPELQADGPRSPNLATPRKLAATSVTQAVGRPPGDARPRLRLVPSTEIDRWNAEDAKASEALVPSSDAPPREPTIVRTASPLPTDDRPRYRRGPRPPERSSAFLFGYRYFRIEDLLGRPQDWHLASIEVTPVRRYVRINLVTEVGFEGGPAATRGDRADLLLMERLGLGMQYPHVVTPFLEFQGGAGGARVELFGRNDLALVYALGLDGGAQWSLGGRMFLHAAIGWIRPTFVWPERTVSYDRVTFKLGFGF